MKQGLCSIAEYVPSVHKSLGSIARADDRKVERERDPYTHRHVKRGTKKMRGQFCFVFNIKQKKTNTSKQRLLIE